MRMVRRLTAYLILLAQPFWAIGGDCPTLESQATWAGSGYVFGIGELRGGDYTTAGESCCRRDGRGSTVYWRSRAIRCPR